MKAFEKKMDKSAEYFDKLACVYDQATNKEGSWTPPGYIYSRIQSYLNTETTILDVGIGTGKSIKAIYNSKKYKYILGVDVSAKMLEVCGRTYPDIDTKVIESISELEYLPYKFDLLLYSGVLEFVEDLRSAFSVSQKLLNNRGLLVFTYEPIICYHTIQKDEVSETVSSVDSRFYVDGFNTYRRNPVDVNSLLIQSRFSIVNDEEFVSYKKDGESIIYHLIMASKD